MAESDARLSVLAKRLMATIGRTLFRFAGALLLGASATSIDNPRMLDAPGPRSRITTVPVVVAAKDIPEGMPVDRAAVVVAQWPVGTQPVGAYRSVEAITNHVTRVNVYKGEAIVPGRLAPPGTGAGPEVRITPGKRAFGIRVNDVAAIAGLVQPNSRVDILVLLDAPQQKKPVAKLFMENVRVLAIGAATERAQDASSITVGVASLEVTPAEAERLAIAASRGSFQLVLRGYGDPDSIRGGSMPNDILRDPKRPKSVAIRAPGRPAPAAESPLCGVHVRPGVIVRYLLNVNCGTTLELEFAKDSAARADSIHRRP